MKLLITRDTAQQEGIPAAYHHLFKFPLFSFSMLCVRIKNCPHPFKNFKMKQIIFNNLIG